MSQVITLVSRYNTCIDGKLTKTTNKVRGSKSIGILSHVVIFREKITHRSLSNTPERIVLTTRKDLNWSSIYWDVTVQGHPGRPQARPSHFLPKSQPTLTTWSKVLIRRCRPMLLQGVVRFRVLEPCVNIRHAIMWSNRAVTWDTYQYLASSSK